MAIKTSQDKEAEAKFSSLSKFVILYILISLADLRHTFCQSEGKICTFISLSAH